MKQLREMIDAPLTRPEVQGDGPVRQVEGDTSRLVGMAERQVLLSSLVPTADQLLSLQNVDAQAALFDVVLTNEREASEALKQAESDLQGWRELQASTPGQLVKAQDRLGKAQTDLRGAADQITQAQGRIAQAQHALDVAETDAAQRGLQEQLLQAMEEETQSRIAELEPFNQSYAQWSDRKSALDRQLQELPPPKSGFFERKRHEKAVENIRSQLAVVEPELRKAEAEWRQKLEEVNFRATAQAVRREGLQAKIDALPKDDAAAAEAVSRSRDALNNANRDLANAEMQRNACEALVGSAQAEVDQLQADLIQIPQEIQALEAVIPQRRQALADAQDQVTEFKIRARPDLRDLLSTRANVLALERDRFSASSLSTQELEDVTRFVQLKLAQIPSDHNERPALLTVAAVAQDEWLVRLDAQQTAASAHSKQVIDQRDAGIRAGDPATRLELQSQKETAELLSELRPHFKFLRGGTTPNGQHTAHPALRLAVALHQVRLGELSPQEAAKAAMAGGSNENQWGILGLLEARRQAVMDGTLEPRAFGAEGQALLQAARNQYGLGNTLMNNTHQFGANVDVLVHVYRSSQRAIDDWTQALNVQQSDVTELQKPAPKPNAMLAALRTVFALGRSEASQAEAAQRAQVANQALSEQLQQALQNVQTVEERLTQAVAVRDQAKYALQAAVAPQNEDTLRSWVSQGVLLRDNHLASAHEVDLYIKVLRESVPADILAA
jgi:hypothetical protein